MDLVRLALRPVRELYGGTTVAEFGPLALKAVRQRMIEKKWCRNVVNKMVGRVKQMFRWAVENELVPLATYHGLQAVAGLQRGRTAARETAPVRPVPEPRIDATRQHVSSAVRAMIDLQLLTGMRPGEVCALRACDIDMTDRVWTYRPASHKTEHHGHDREVYFGPQAQAIIKPFLKLDTQAYLFSPWEAREERYREMRARRKTKVQPSQVNRRKRRPKRPPRDHYEVNSYRRAIAYACEKAFPLPEHLGPRSKESKRAWQARLTPEERATVRRFHRRRGQAVFHFASAGFSAAALVAGFLAEVSWRNGGAAAGIGRVNWCERRFWRGDKMPPLESASACRADARKTCAASSYVASLCWTR